MQHCKICRGVLASQIQLRSGQAVCAGCARKLENALPAARADLARARAARTPSNVWDYVSGSVLIAGILMAIAAGISLGGTGLSAPGFLALLAATAYAFAACRNRSERQDEPLVAQLKARIASCEEQVGKAAAALSDLYEQYWARPPDWAERRSLVIHRAGGRCEQCGRRQAGSRVPFHVHHVIPRSEPNGHHGVSNLRLLCEICHGKQSEPGHERVAGARAARFKRRRSRE